jgi:hypothetical protein
MNKMQEWMHKASTKEQQELARRAKTSRPYLYVLSNDKSNHSREAQPLLAARIERASLAMRERNPKLPPILRTELNSACRQCEYAKMCQGLK